MTDKRRDHDLTVANLVDHDATEDDSKTKPRESRSTDRAKLGRGEAEFLAPVVKDTAANGKTDAGGEDGGEAGPEEPSGIGGDRLVANLVIAHNEDRRG